MKTTILALAAAMPIMAGTPAYIETEPVNPYSIETAVSYNFAARNIFKFGDFKGPKVDTMGVDITGVYTVNENSSFNLRFGYAGGSDDNSDGNGDDYGYRLRARVNNFYLMPGYRYTHRLSDYFSGFIGANIGVINQSVKFRVSDDDYVGKAHGSDYGFAYSAEAGLRYEISKHFDLFVAYQFFGSTAEASGSNRYYDDTHHGHTQLYHCVRVGASFDF